MISEMLINLKEEGVKTLDWEEYKFDSQYEEGSSVLLNVVADAYTGIRADMVTCTTRLDFILGVRNLKRKYGDNCVIYFAKTQELIKRGSAVIALGDLVIDNEADLDDIQKSVLEEYAKIIQSKIEDKGISLQWGINSKGELIIEGIK